MLLAMGSLITLTVWGQFGSEMKTSLLAVDVAVGVASWALLPVLLRWPVPAAVALSVLAALSPAATPSATFAVLYVAQRRRFALAAMVAGVGITAHLVRGGWRPITPLPYVWWFLLVVVAYGTFVAWGALDPSTPGAPGRRYTSAPIGPRPTRPRRRRSPDLGADQDGPRNARRARPPALPAGHLRGGDGVPARRLARATSPRGAGVIRSGAHQALEGLRQVISVFRDNHSTTAKLAHIPTPGLANLPLLVEESRDAGTCVQLCDSLRSPDALPAAVGRTVYRVVQEGLTNAHKHAAGQTVRIALDGTPGGRLVIDVTKPTAPRGAGLPTTGGIRDRPDPARRGRVGLAGGELTTGQARASFDCTSGCRGRPEPCCPGPRRRRRRPRITRGSR